MDGHRFDMLTRRLCGADLTRRRVLTGLGLALVARFGRPRGAGAACAPGTQPCRTTSGTACVACPSGQTVGAGCRCVCRLTGRPPVGGICPCPAGQVDTGDGRGCLACRVTADCPPSGDVCATATCVNGACQNAPLCPGGVCCAGTCAAECCDDLDCPDLYECVSGSCVFSCFIAGTRIAMADGSSRPIELVAIGDQVIGRDGEINRVLGVRRALLGDQPLYALNDGQPFVTASHPFLTTAGWKAIDPPAARRRVPDLAIGRLTTGDHLLALAETRVPALVGATAQAPVEVTLAPVPLDYLTGQTAPPQTPIYTLSLDGNQTYFANDLLVHNKE